MGARRPWQTRPPGMFQNPNLQFPLVYFELFFFIFPELPSLAESQANCVFSESVCDNFGRDSLNIDPYGGSERKRAYEP
jgi:hypothetical protein